MPLPNTCIVRNRDRPSSPRNRIARRLLDEQGRGLRGGGSSPPLSERPCAGRADRVPRAGGRRLAAKEACGKATGDRGWGQGVGLPAHRSRRKVRPGNPELRASPARPAAGRAPRPLGVRRIHVSLPTTMVSARPWSLLEGAGPQSGPADERNSPGTGIPMPVERKRLECPPTGVSTIGWALHVKSSCFKHHRNAPVVRPPRRGAARGTRRWSARPPPPSARVPKPVDVRGWPAAPGGTRDARSTVMIM